MTAAEIGAERAAVVAEVRSWAGTAFHHQGRVKGVGVDCAQLVIAVFADALHLVPPIEPGYYPPDWFLHQSRERIVEWVERYWRRVDAAAAGDLVLFRFGRALSHSGIVVQVEPARVVHSFAGQGVLEGDLVPGTLLWLRRDSYWTLARWSTP